MTHEACLPVPSTSLAHQSPKTAALPSPASPLPTAKVLSKIPSATRLLYSTCQPALGLLSSSTRPAAAKASARTRPRLPQIQMVGYIPAFTTAAATTASLAGLTTTRAVHSLGICTSHGTTLLMEAASESAFLLTTVALGPSDNWLLPVHSSVMSRSRETWPQALSTSRA